MVVFYVSIKKSDTTVSGYAVEIRLRITQHSRDIILMESLILYLGCGRVEEESKAYPPPLLYLYLLHKKSKTGQNKLVVCSALLFFYKKEKISWFTKKKVNLN